jgi:hypothetical protein
MTTEDNKQAEWTAGLEESMMLLDKSWGELREQSDRELARLHAQMLRSAILLLGWKFWLRHPIHTIRALLIRP